MAGSEQTPERGPLVLGSGGRVGTMLRRLAAQGLWPGPEPLWHTRDGRDGTLGWDMGAEQAPAWEPLPKFSGIVVLAGQTREEPGSEHLSEKRRIIRLGEGNSHPATRAIEIALERGCGPVLLCSSAAVYGAAPDIGREDDRVRGSTIYGNAKLHMEEHVGALRVTASAMGRDFPSTCALRIGNVAGADALFGAMASGPVTLDRLAGGTSPRRACIGPLTLARALVALLALDDLPPLLNLAQPGLVAMSDLLDAAGVPFSWRPAPPSALPALEMDLSRLQALAPLPPATPQGLVAEARLAGWRPWGERP